MEHTGVDLIQLTIVAVVALIGGLLFARIKQPPILGYLLTGIILGPTGFAMIDARDQITSLADLGVLLLLFVIGMESNLRLLKKVWPVAVFCTVLQISLSLGISFALGKVFCLTPALATLIGFIIALSSTAVVFRLLESISEFKTETGQLTIGILLAQDLAIVPMVLIIKSFNIINPNGVLIFFKIIGSLGFIIALTIYLSRKNRIHIPLTQIISGEKELIPIVNLTFCFGASAITGILGLSIAYGAFLAGLILGNTHERLTLLEATKPIESVLLMIFFLSIGLLLDLEFLKDNIKIILSVLIIIMFSKTAINVGILHLLRLPWSQSFLIGVVLAQLGEFSFLLASLSEEIGIIDHFWHKLILSVTVLSLILSPVWLACARYLKDIRTDQWINSKTISNIFPISYVQMIKKKWKWLFNRFLILIRKYTRDL